MAVVMGIFGTIFSQGTPFFLFAGFCGVDHCRGASDSGAGHRS
jgi:hypothetical protein